MLTLKIGQRYRIKVASLLEAQAVYCRMRDESGEGASTWPNGVVSALRISYNGRIWESWYINDVEIDPATGLPIAQVQS